MGKDLQGLPGLNCHRPARFEQVVNYLVTALNGERTYRYGARVSESLLAGHEGRLRGHDMDG